MAIMPAKACAVAAQPNAAAAGQMFLLVLLVVSLLTSAVHARAVGPIAIANHLVAASGGCASLSSTVWYGSTCGACQSHSLPSVPCRGCRAVCHTPAGLVTTAKLSAPGTAVHYFSSVVTPVSTKEDENYKVAQVLGVYLGVLPAAIARGHLESHPEATMHGGASRGLHEYHIIIAVFEAATGARIENAKVTATVSGLGHVGQNSVVLEPMAIAGTVTYGGFITLPGSDRYDILVDIRVPGRPVPARVSFTYQH